MLFSQYALAGISSKRSSGSSSSSSGVSSSTVPEKQSKVDDTKWDARDVTASTTCSQDPNIALNFPLDFFQHVSQKDGTSLSFEVRADNKIVVKMPPSIISCGKFKPQPIQDRNNAENVVIAMALDTGKTYGEYIKCLEEKKYLVDGKIDHDNIPSSEYADYSYVVDYNFDKVKDIKKTIKLSYGYPKNFMGRDGYKEVFGFDPSVAIPPTHCMVAEKVASEVTYLNKGQDVLLQEYASICRTGTAQQIADARRSVGNAEALKDIAEKLKASLDAGYLAAVKNDVERIMKDMDKLENQINKEKDTMDEKTAKNVAKKYADLARELDTMYLNPAIKHLADLMDARAAMEEGDGRDKVDEEIKTLNQEIGKFSSRNQTAFANLYGLMEKYALTDSAKNIEDIRLKSYVYSRVFMGSASDKRGTPMTLEQANQKQVNIMQSFEKTLNDWTDQYLVGQGNTYPIKKTEKERQAAVNKMNTRWQKYQENEQKTYNKHCTGIFGASNPVRCRDFMSGAEQRRASEVKKWQKDNQFVATRNAKLERMGGNYNTYLQTTAEQRSREADNYNPWGSSYTSFEDNFGDQYPAYQAPTDASSGYQAWRYSMGQQQPGGAPGGMMMPQQQQYYNPQVPVQQGQFQMQQPQMMQWASM